jgi:hypothetical protein
VNWCRRWTIPACATSTTTKEPSRHRNQPHNFACSPLEANQNMSDQIIDALMACAAHTDAARTHPLVGWIVMRDQPDYPDEMIARLVKGGSDG